MTRILFNCDDFGKSHEVNAAILKAHREGLLQSTSLMVTGACFDEAVEIARANPSLRVGLHIVLSEGKPALEPSRVHHLINGKGLFLSDPAKAGIRLATNPEAKSQAALEVQAQFERFMSTGLVPAHVDGHHHLHMHPFVFSQCVYWAEKFSFRRIRLVREFGNPLPPRRDSKEFFVKWVRHLTFQTLAARNVKLLKTSKLIWLKGVLGLWETGRVSEDYLLHAIPQLPKGDWEIYNHVGSQENDEELQAMLSPAVKSLLKKQGIESL